MKTDPMVLDDRRLRVLHLADIINRRDFIDVIVRHADPEAFWLGACTFSAASNIEDPRFADDDIPHWVLPATKRSQYPVVAARLARLLRSQRIDILHTHHYDPAVVGAIATRLHPSTRLIVGRHYSDAISLNSTGMRRRALLGAEALVNRTATRIIVPTRMIRDLLVDTQHVAASKVDLIPYAFDSTRYGTPSDHDVARARQGFDAEGRFVVGTFARLYRDKGHRYLAEALASLPATTRRSLRWVVVGDGPDRSEVERVIEEFGIEDLTIFLGWRNDALLLMAACDVIVQPTVQEAFSQAMVEALWMRRPLVMSRVSGVDDLMTDGVNGLVVPPRDPPALAAAIERIRNDAVLAASLAEAGRRVVESTLTPERILPRYERAYREAYGMHTDTAPPPRADRSDEPVSLVIPVRNETASLAALLESVARQSRPPDEILIVDGGSSDDTPALARALTVGDPRVRIIELADATPGAGRNAGIAAARHDWVALTDAGIELDAGWLEALVSRAASNAEIGAVFGMYDPFPGSFFERCAALAYVAPVQSVHGRSTRGPSIASSLLRRSVWQAAGEFPDLRAAEDCIFIEAVERSGTTIAFAPEARVWWHLQPTMARTFGRFREYSRHNVRARQGRSWHHGVARQYIVALPFLALALRRPRWLAVPAIGFSVRVLGRIWHGRGAQGVRWTINPARVALVGAMTVTVDGAMFLGWVDALRTPTRATPRRH